MNPSFPVCSMEMIIATPKGLLWGLNEAVLEKKLKWYARMHYTNVSISSIKPIRGKHDGVDIGRRKKKALTTIL